VKRVSAEALAAAADGAVGSVVLLSANPIHDTGGGQRSAQLALELLARDFAVLFVSHGEVTETVDLALALDHDRLLQAPLATFDDPAATEALAPLWSLPTSLVVTQVPVRRWIPVLDAARAAGAVQVYDCIDRWDSELGRGWYDPAAEQDVARRAQVLTASAPALVEHVERLAGREARLLPNAYNARLFNPTRFVEGAAPAASRPAHLPDSAGSAARRPADLPRGRTALYVGALWGGWMDWTLVDAAARRYPHTSFVFIGDHRREGRGLPDNCVFLGLKPQTELPEYLAAADVAFLPWTSDAVTHATSPLKVYEFVAMQLPVVAPDIEPLRGIPGVTPCDGSAALLEAIGSVDRARTGPETRARMARFSAESSWSSRVDALLQEVQRAATDESAGPAPRIRTTGATISVVVPSYNHERYLAAAMDGVRDQSLPASELVIVDDGSGDRSREVIEEHRFAGVRAYFQENRGAHRALNRAIALARGEWIAILNSDDVFEPHRLEHAWGVARATGAALVCGSVRLIGEDGGAADPGHPISRWYEEALAHARSSRSLRATARRHNVAVTTSNFFLHRSLWEALGGFAAYRYVHDYEFLLRAVALCPDRVRWAEELTGVLYRVHGANTISESEVRAQEERRAMLGALRRPTARLRRLWARPRAARAVRSAVDGDVALAPVVELGPAAVLEGGAAAPVPSTRVSADAPVGGEAGRSLSVPPLRVGLVAESLGSGGLEEVVALLAQTLPALGASVSVLCAGTGGPVAERLRRAGLPVRVARGRRDEWRAWLREERPDVVSTHFASLDVVEALAEGGIPIVETIHNVYAWLRPDDWARERAKLERIDGTVAVSRMVAEHYGGNTGRAPDRVIPNAVHPGRAACVPRAWARRRLGVADEAPLFVSVGRLAVQKNPAGLLASFERAHGEAPEARLLLVGSVDRSVSLAALRRRWGALFRSGVVRHLGTVEDVGTVLSAADVFVSASFHEGWSVAASEALWAGRPVVLSETGGSVELTGERGERGIVVPNACGRPLAADPETIVNPPAEAAAVAEAELAEALVEVVRTRDEWAAKADEIRGYARTALAPAVMGRRYLEALEAVAPRDGASV
jgi:glycosyltransferase involved in cell wall biosynthesis